MSYVYLPRHTEEEYQRYTPKEYGRVETARKTFAIGFICFLILVGVLGYLVSTDADRFGPWLGWSFISFLGVCLVGVVILQTMHVNLDYRVDNNILKERDAFHTQVTQMENDIKSVADRVRDIKATGHVVMAGDGTTVIIGSDVSNSFNVVRSNDPALADALQTISGAVEKSGNKDAGLAWERFVKQAVGERDKTVLSALWDRVVKLVPDVTKLIESVAKIVALFA